MKKLLYFTGIVLLTSVYACNKKPPEISSIAPENWDKRQVTNWEKDVLKHGATYLPVYSQIYSETEHRTHPLTGTVSMRNMNLKDTAYITKAQYYNTAGELIRTYLEKPVFLAPMETVEIVIDQEDQEGGTGANFLFEWATPDNAHAPFFECVMISTYGQQGLSFTTQGKRLE